MVDDSGREQGEPKGRETTSEDAQLLRDEAALRLKRWDRLGGWWSFTHYLAGLLGVTFTVTGAVVSGIDGVDRSIPIVLGILSALLVSFVAFVNPAKSARNYRAAWRQLDSRRLDELQERTQEALEHLTEAIADGERILAGRDPE